MQNLETETAKLRAELTIKTKEVGHALPIMLTSAVHSHADEQRGVFAERGSGMEGCQLPVTSGASSAGQHSSGKHRLLAFVLVVINTSVTPRGFALQ